MAELFAEFLRAAGIEVTAVAQRRDHHGGRGGGRGARTSCWRWPERVDHPDAEAVLLPDTALHTASHIPTLEKDLGKPVLTANQVTVWEALRLTDRKVNAPALGTLFTRSPDPGLTVAWADGVPAAPPFSPGTPARPVFPAHPRASRRPSHPARPAVEQGPSGPLGDWGARPGTGRDG